MNRKISGDGISFLTSVSFHDAKLVDVRYDEKYGKEHLLLFVDFKNAYAPPAGGNLFEISFSGGKCVQEPKRMKDCHILALDCAFESNWSILWAAKRTRMFWKSNFPM